MTHTRFIFFIFSLIFIPTTNSAASADKGYFKIESSINSSASDLDVTSIGAIVFENNMAGSINLSYLDSDYNGKAMALDLAGGVVLRGRLSLRLMLGFTAGYNWDIEEAVTAYYPEIGLVLGVTDKIGLSLSGKRYIKLYEKDENLLILGIVINY